MNINIYAIGHIYFASDKIHIPYLNRPIDNFFAKSCFGGFLDFILKSFHSLFFFSLKFKKTSTEYQGVLTFGLTNNNRNTLKPITEEIGSKKVCSITDRKDFPMWRVYFYAYPYLFRLLREYRKAKSNDKEIIRFFFAKFWRMYGCKKVAERMIKLYQPKVIVLSNDHLEMNRVLMEVANEKGVKTMYVQHASVTDKFPPLHFTYSMLDGEDSFEKYKGVGDMKGNVYLSGGVRFDSVKKKDIESVRAIGVAINTIDNDEKVKETCIKLRDRYIATRIVLRPHPSMNQDAWRNWCEKNGIGFSCSAEQSSFVFLSSLTFMISNQSSIHLDAAMNHVPSVIYNMSDMDVEDHYGYKAKKLVPATSTIEELFSTLDNVEQYKYDTGVVRFFNSSFETPFEGKVASMIAELINCIVEDKKISEFNEKNHFFLNEKGDDYKSFVFQ